jgi:hypothetical protein
VPYLILRIFYKIFTIQGATAVKMKPVITSFERFTLVMAKPVALTSAANNNIFAASVSDTGGKQKKLDQISYTLNCSQSKKKSISVKNCYSVP